MIEKGIATQEELDTIQNEAKKTVRDAKKAAWNSFLGEIKNERDEAVSLLKKIDNPTVSSLLTSLESDPEPIRKLVLKTVRKSLRATRGEDTAARNELTILLGIFSKGTTSLFSLETSSKTSPSFDNILDGTGGL